MLTAGFETNRFVLWGRQLPARKMRHLVYFM